MHPFPLAWLLCLLFVVCNIGYSLGSAKEKHHRRLTRSTKPPPKALPLPGVPPMQFSAIPAGLMLPSCQSDPIFGTCGPTHNLVLTNASNLTAAAYGGR